MRDPDKTLPSITMKTRLFIPVLFATATLLAVTGCSTVNLDSTGETQAVYNLGQFEMLMNSTAPAVYGATQKALKDLDLFQIKAKLNTYDAEIQARARNDQKISISIAEINSRQTMLKIRWGTTGSKVNSRALYEAIEKNLK